jgi:hypothetical protein
MTRSSIERQSDGLVAFLKANIDEYIDRANLSAVGVAAKPRRIDRTDLIPPEGPFPYIMVTVDEISNTPSGQGCALVEARFSINVAIKEAKPIARDLVVHRYIDALLDLFNEHPTANGIFDLSVLETIDKLGEPNGGIGFVLATLKTSCEVLT